MIDLLAATAIAMAHPPTGTVGTDVYAYGVVSEDESGWSCVDDGNRVCGPGNGQAVPAAWMNWGQLTCVYPLRSARESAQRVGTLGFGRGVVR